MQIGWFAAAPYRGSSLFAPVFAAAGKEERIGTREKELALRITPAKQRPLAVRALRDGERGMYGFALEDSGKISEEKTHVIRLLFARYRNPCESFSMDIFFFF